MNANAPSVDPGSELSRGSINVEGAREHNLKNIDIGLPKGQLIVFTGPSGSGKSSLAFDTIYAEGRRRYVESLSTYARQFVGNLNKADFDYLEGLSPTISIAQKTASTNPRSTVGTVTEIYDHLRVFYARLGKQFCHNCGRPVTSMSKNAITGSLLALDEGTKFMLLAPLIRNRKGEYRDLFEDLRQEGFNRVRIDGQIQLLDDVTKLEMHQKHDIEVVVDRLISKPDQQARIAESLELALSVGEGQCIVVTPEDDTEKLFSTERACTHCNISFPELTHQSFSFNSKLGQCPRCEGIGKTPQASLSTLVIDEEKSIREGAVEAMGPDPESDERNSFRYEDEAERLWGHTRQIASEIDLDLDAAWSELPMDKKRTLLEGTADTEGLGEDIIYLSDNADTKSVRDFFGEFIVQSPCPKCEESRLRPKSDAVKFRGKSISEVCSLPLDDALEFFDGLTLEGREATIGLELADEIASRLEFLLEVGLDYLTLNRSATSLSGGESQRIRLASQLGNDLSGILYILDEPSIGLHARDQNRLIDILARLRDQDNSVIVVEHDRDTMERADLLVDFGPGAGRDGGDIVGFGTPETFQDEDSDWASDSETAQFLSGNRKIDVPDQRRDADGEAFEIRGARHHNLKDIDVSFPVGNFICVTGVSGAGKSSLVNETLWPALARHLYTKHRYVGEHDAIEGLDLFDKAIRIDQKPIGRTPRSNPATYTKVFDHIRDFFANLPESKMYGFDKGRFSFNTKEGRCEACKGRGAQKIEMKFLADVYTECEQCQGARYDNTTLRIKYRGHTIADVLDMTIAEAADVFEKHPKISRILETLMDVGLGYVKLGQPSPTLSGGEAQRVKLSRELAKIQTGDTLYILDEPSTGLHFHDIEKLLDVIDQIVEDGNTVIVIEHDMDIIKSADHLIDLGPGGGPKRGGQLVASGTPEEVAEVDDSYTGEYLQKHL
jgi:excinuclease ABC subunit A